MNNVNLDLENNESFVWRTLFFVCCTMIIITASDAAFATSGSGTTDVVGEAICRLVNNLSGGIARGIATMAIFAAGVGVFTGKLKWEIAASIAAGVGIIFAAPKLVGWLSGDSTNSTCTATVGD